MLRLHVRFFVACGEKECVSGGVLVSVREKGKRELKKNMDMGEGWGKKKKMGKDECQIDANLRDDNALYYNHAILASVTHFSCISIQN